MRTLLLSGLLSTCVALTPLSAHAAGKKAPGAEAVKQWTLPNKLHVIFVPDHKAPVVAVQVFYHVGGKDEPEGKRGMAHMFEHMMFKGSKHVKPEEHARFIDAVGGNENAFTQDDVTAYHETIPPSALDFSLKLEAERMRNLVLTQKTIDSERQVVEEELRVNFENNPIMTAFSKALKMAYTTHPYRIMAIGDKKSLDSVTPAECQKFYDLYYQPNNATVVVVGDTDEATVRKLVQQYFGPIPAAAEPPRPSKALTEPQQTAQRENTMAIPVQLPVVIGAYHVPPSDSADIVALEVAQQILSSGESSRMYQRLVHNDKLAVAAGAQLETHEDPGLFLTFAAFLPGGDGKKARLAIEDELAKMAAAPVTEHELTKAKNQLAVQAAQIKERVEMLATRIGIDTYVAHDPLRGFSVMAKYDAVTAADVQRVAKKYLVPTNETVVTLQPLGRAVAPGGAQ